jgi:hypothetical protein
LREGPVIKTQIKNGKENADILVTNGHLDTNATIKNYIFVKKKKKQAHLRVIQITKVKKKVRPPIQKPMRPCPRFPWQQ